MEIIFWGIPLREISQGMIEMSPIVINNSMKLLVNKKKNQNSEIFFRSIRSKDWLSVIIKTTSLPNYYTSEWWTEITSYGSESVTLCDIESDIDYARTNTEGMYCINDTSDHWHNGHNLTWIYQDLYDLLIDILNKFSKTFYAITYSCICNNSEAHYKQHVKELFHSNTKQCVKNYSS